MSLKYAIIGCGRISPNHIEAAKQNHLDFVGLCDLDIENIEDKKLKFNLSDKIKMYTDYNIMIDEQEIDLLAICTESGKHASIALNCIEKNINLIIEKPIALSLKDADKIIEKAEQKNVKVSACHQNRFNKSIQKIRDSLDKKRFGKLFHANASIRWNRRREYYERAKWRGTWEQDGGALMNQCIHNIDLLRWMMGNKIDEVVAYTDNLNHDYVEAEDLGVALIKFSNGSYGIIEGTTNVYPENLEETLTIFGSKGTVKASGKSVNKIDVWRFADYLDDPEKVKEKFQESPPNVYGYGHISLYKDVINAINNNTEPYITAVDGRNALELVLGIYKSALKNKPVKFPLKDSKSTDFKGMF